VTAAHRSLATIAIVLGFLSIAGAGSYWITKSTRRSDENEHTMKCLAAYVAFVQIIGGSEEERIARLRTCERSPIGEEPLHLNAREHPFVVDKYEGCLAAHLLMATDLQKSLSEQQRYCR
jgi:hypothetical protein